jgi:SNF2 family DNA or RNA helicase
LTQSQTQPQDADLEEALEEATDDDVEQVSSSKTKRPSSSKARSRNLDRQQTPEEDSDESFWGGSDGGQDAYAAWKGRSTAKRKRVAAETNRIRAQKKTRTAVATSIVGRKVMPKKRGKERAGLSTDSAADGSDQDAAYLDEPIPDYIDSRKAKLKKLHEAGLRYPPNYEDIDFSDDESEERPILSSHIKTQRPKKDIVLRESGAIIPAPIAQWLREYQVEGVQFLHERFVKQTGAILGDDMGLGKTIQVIAFLTAAFGKTGTQRDAKCMRKIRRYGDGRWYPRVMIVCPGTLMRNWEDELEKWGWWQVYKFHGNPADRRGVLGAAKKGMLEILITTYDTYRNNEGEINTIDWDCVIADECHQIKNKLAQITKAMNKVNALCRIGLTGTAIQNKYEELWNLLNWARPGAYGSAQEWKQMVALPLKMGQAHDASYAQLANARSKAKELVEGILPSVFLRRMKTLIADQLPKKSDRVVFCQLTETQADAYREYIESDKCSFIRTAKEPCDCGSGKKRGWCCYVEVPGEGEKWAKFMFPCMISLQKLANHLALLLPVTSDPNEKQSKDLDNLKTACPENWKDMYRIRDSVLHQSQREFCGKWKVLKRLLDFWHSNGDKVLVFSHSVRLLRLLKALFDLDGTKYNFSYLDGSMSYEDRAVAVAEFNSKSDQFVFLISTRAGGVGLNITSANKVVVVDPNWNPAYDLQAQDRAYRIGQTRDVEVFRLISSGTIEEIVYARQIYKQQQANIGYTASHERRYFKGVMDQSEKKGELFGLENLFTFQENNLLLRDVLHKTNVAETRAGVSAVSCNFEDTQLDSDDDDDILSNKALGLPDDDDINLESQIKKIAQSFTSASSDGSKKKSTKRVGPDPINAILAKAGVQYTHENSEVIGRSEIEAKLGEQAMELRNDVDFARKRVFAASQSQSQSQAHQRDDDIEYSDDSNDDTGNHDDDFRMIGIGKEGGKEFRVNYRYRPDEQVRKRQFCEMSRMWGYDDPVEFALLVEGLKQAERRKMLEKFYRARRRGIMGEFEAAK